MARKRKPQLGVRQLARAHRTQRCRPQIEQLEIRVLPATLQGLVSADLSFTDNVTVVGDVLVNGSRVIDATGYNLDLGASFKIAGDAAGGRDSITIKADEVTIRGQIGGGGMQNITIQASKISILDNALLTTRLIGVAENATNFDIAASTGNSGDLDLEAPTIIVKIETAGSSGPKLYTHVLTGDSSHTGGKITMTAEDKETRLNILPWGYSDKQVGITVQNAAPKGASVDLEAAAEDKNPQDNFPSWANKIFFDPLFQVPSYLINSLMIPASVQWRGSNAGVTVQDSNLNASGAVTLSTSAIVDASVNAITTINKANPLSHVAIAFGRGTGTAQTFVRGSTQIVAGGEVDITSSVKNTAKSLAQVFGNINQLFTPANANEGGGSIAFSWTNTTSKAIVENGSSITAGGKVGVKAKGDVKSEAEAKTAVYINGSAALGLSGNWDTPDVAARVDGSIVGGAEDVGNTIALSSINNANDTIAVPANVFKTGDEFVYSAGGGTPIQGLNDGETYKIVVVDSTHIKLAKTTAIDIDNQGLNSNVRHSLSPANAYFVDPATNINPTTDEFTGFSTVDSSNVFHPGTMHGLVTGQAVTYFADDNGTELDGLTTQGEYYVIVTSPTTFKLASTLDRAARGQADVDLTAADLQNPGHHHVLNFVTRAPASVTRTVSAADYAASRITFAQPH